MEEGTLKSLHCRLLSSKAVLFSVFYSSVGIFVTNHLPFLLDIPRQNQHFFASKGTGGGGGGQDNNYGNSYHFTPVSNTIGLVIQAAVRRYPGLK